MAVLHTKAIFSREAFVKELPEGWRAITSKARTTNAINNNRKDFYYLFLVLTFIESLMGTKIFKKFCCANIQRK